MAEVFDCNDSAQLLAGSRAVRQAITRGELVVLPTDTVYGIAADAFTPQAVSRLLRAKGRERDSPPPVLIPDMATLSALAADVTPSTRALAEAFWPGALTILVAANPSLSWDLGDTGGTVALRIPDHPLTLELLRETGPLAVSSANKTGNPAAQNIAEARRMLGDHVGVYLDAGPMTGDGMASTIIDTRRLDYLDAEQRDRSERRSSLRVLREGVVSIEALQAVLPSTAISLDVKSGG